MKDIIVTTPKSEIANAAREAEDVKRAGGGMYFRRFPPSMSPDVRPGDRVYYVDDDPGVRAGVRGVGCQMKERPILFSGDMVLALLAGTKTQTRRVINLLKLPLSLTRCDLPIDQQGAIKLCSYGVPGDRLWVRETFHKSPDGIEYRADDNVSNYAPDDSPKWKPSIFMPRTASRLTLEITDVRVQRVQEISEEDARAEGVEAVCVAEGEDGAGPVQQWSYVQAFAELWQTINGKTHPWESNPFCWCLTFRRLP